MIPEVFMRFLLFLFLMLAAVPSFASEDVAYEEYSLGGKYLIGDGVNQDHKEAVKHFRKAADMGLAIAQYYLSRCYADGKGVPKDNREAFFWATIAARGKDKFITDYREELARKLSWDEIAEIQSNADKWIPVSPAVRP